MIRAHKIKLYPNNKQRDYFKKACGVARFAYNWALNEWVKRYEKGEKVTEGQLRKDLNAIKKEQFPWMLEVTKCAPQLAIKQDLNRAFQNFFAKRASFPKFHKKGVHDSFSISNDQFKLQNRSVKIPNLGWVRLSEELRFDGKIISATISRTADSWYIAIQVELPEQEKKTHTSKNQAVGVDLGIKALATLSDGTRIVGSKASRRYEKQLKRLNQSISRKKGSKKGEPVSGNFKKAKRKISRLYAKIVSLRQNQMHQLTAKLTKEYSIVGVEDLNVTGMMKNHKLARSIADMSFYEFRRQLTYKAEATGSQIVVADRWYASSKQCSSCGTKWKELSLTIREWKCSACGTHHDRDVNAAINLKKYALLHI